MKKSTQIFATMMIGAMLLIAGCETFSKADMEPQKNAVLETTIPDERVPTRD